MSLTKRYLEEQQDKFAVMIFEKDGCPSDEAKNYTWCDVVERFYDGDDDKAYEEFLVYHENGLIK